MRDRNLLIIFLFSTGFGSALSAIATFIRVEEYFGSLKILGIILSVKTIVAFFISYISGRYLSHNSVIRNLKYSQLIGLVSLVFLYVGFDRRIFSLVVCGVILSSIPLVLVNIGVVSRAKTLHRNESSYRNLSGVIESVCGLYLLLACLLAPAILQKFSIGFVFCVDAFTYLIGLVVLGFWKNSQEQSFESEQKINSTTEMVRDAKGSGTFLIFLSSLLVLAALGPLMASSSEISVTKNVPKLLREYFWTLEAVMISISGLVYHYLHRWLQHPAINVVLICNGIILFLFTFSVSPAMVALVLVANGLIQTVGFAKGRDDFLADAKSEAKIQTKSAIAFGYRSFMQAVSPLLLVFLLSETSIEIASLFIFTLQLILILSYFWVSKASKINILEVNRTTLGVKS